jgi:hypothetical protein
VADFVDEHVSDSLDSLRRAALEATFDMGRDVTDLTDEEFIAALVRE